MDDHGYDQAACRRAAQLLRQEAEHVREAALDTPDTGLREALGHQSRAYISAALARGAGMTEREALNTIRDAAWRDWALLARPYREPEQIYWDASFAGHAEALSFQVAAIVNAFWCSRQGRLLRKIVGAL